MILMKFKEFLNETNMMKAAGDGKEPDKHDFIVKDRDSFIKQDDEEKLVKPTVDDEGKPLFNTGGTTKTN